MDNTIRVRKGNVILDVPERDKDRYVADGYSVLDIKTGKVIVEAIPNDPGELKVIIGKLKAENETLKSENETLKAEIEKLKKKPAKKDAE